MNSAVGAAAAAPLAGRVAREHVAAARLAYVAGGGVVASTVALGAAGAVWALGDGRWAVAAPAVPALCWAALGATGAIGAMAAGQFARRATSRDRVVRHVESERALRAGALRVALDVAGAGPMGALAAAQLAPALATHAGALAPAWRGRLARWAASAGVALAAAAGVLTLSAARWPDGASALAHPIDAARGTLLPPLRLLNAPTRIARGRALQLTVDAPGRRRVDVTWRVAGHPWATRAFVPSTGGRALFALDAVDADLVVVATDGRAQTDTLRIPVDDRAFVGTPRLHAVYPAYLGLVDADVPLGDTVRVPRGTVLELRARASAPTLRAQLVEGADAHGIAHAAGHVGDSLVVRWAPVGVARVAWTAAGDDRGPVDVPDPFVVVAVPDAPPTASAALQEGAYDGATPVIVAITAGDDHGLAAVRIHVFRRRANAADIVASAPITLYTGGGAPSASWAGSATVDPARLGIAPGEAAVVRIEAVDASPWTQHGWSTPLVLSAPSTATVRSSARATGDSALSGVTAALAAARDLEQRTADAARSRTFGARSAATSGSSGTPNGADRAAEDRGAAPTVMSYEAAERARALAAQQRQLAATVAAARAQTEALERRMHQAGALDSALARQLAEARRMLQDALTPELAAKLAAMEQGGAGMSASQARATLEQLAEAQRALRERLERTADLLRRAALEGAMQTLGDEAREVAAAEARAIPPGGSRPRAGAAAGARANGESPAQTAARAAAVRDAVDSLRARLGREQATAGANGAAQANAHAARSAQTMQRAADAPSAGGAEAAAQSAATEMRAAADALARGRSAQIDAWKATLGAELDRAASETAQLAREQAAVREAARGGTDAAGARSAEAAVREGVEQTARRLEQAGRTSALLSERTRRAMDEARQQVGAAARALERPGGAPPGAPTAGATGGGAPGGAAGAGRSPDAAMAAAEEALARASGALVRDRARVRDANSATGGEEVLAQFRAAAGQQGQVNAQSLALPQQGSGSGAPGKPGQDGTQGGGRDPGGREAARRLAEEQRAIADRLDRIGDADASGRSDELAREARALAASLDRQAAGTAPGDPATLARQQQLYRKLLEAGQSLERDEQDDRGPRQARAGVSVGGGAPADGPVRGAAAARVAPPTWNELRALAPDERRLVLEYFRRLNAAARP